MPLRPNEWATVTYARESRVTASKSAKSETLPVHAVTFVDGKDVEVDSPLRAARVRTKRFGTVTTTYTVRNRTGKVCSSFLIDHVAKPGYKLVPGSAGEAALDARFQSPAVYRFRLSLPATASDADRQVTFVVVERKENVESTPLLAWSKEEALKHVRSGLVTEDTVAAVEAVRGRVKVIDAAKTKLDAAKRRISELDVTSTAVDVRVIERLVAALEDGIFAFDNE
jgi:hypothetical protein